MSENNKPAPEVGAQARDGKLADSDGLFDACINGVTDIGINHRIQTGTISANVFEREYPNEDIRDRRHIEAGLFLLDVATRDAPLAEEAYNAIVRLSEILVRRGLLPVAYDRAHTIHLSEPISEVTVLKLMEDAGTA